MPARGSTGSFFASCLPKEKKQRLAVLCPQHQLTADRKVQHLRIALHLEHNTGNAVLACCFARSPDGSFQIARMNEDKTVWLQSQLRYAIRAKLARIGPDGGIAYPYYFPVPVFLA